MSVPVSSTRGASALQRTIYFLRLGRPLHLIGGFIFHALGISAALYAGASFTWGAAVWCQIAITATQLMTHYSNDYFDQDADAATVLPTRWASGSRILPKGLLEPRAALIGALVCGGVALAATAVLVTISPGPLQTLALLLLSIGLAWTYSSPPLWLNRRGLGEVTATVLVPGLTTLLGFQVQAGQVALLPMLAAVPLCCFQLVMLLSVNLPDVVGDTQVNKRTLVVIIGPLRTGRLFITALALAYLLLPALVGLGLPTPVALALLPTLPLAAWQSWRIHRGAATDPAQWEALGFWSIGLLMAAAVLETAVFLALTAGAL